MQPGLTRALPMSIIGFVLGAALVVLLRALQGFTGDAVWNAQLGVIMGGFNATIFFMLGMGAFDAKLAQHHVEAHYDDEKGEIVVEGLHDHDEEHEGEPSRVLTGEIWQVTFWTLVAIIGLFALATISFGPALTVSNDPTANANTIGYFTVEIAGQTVVVSQLTAFVLFTAFTVLSLAGISWVIGRTFFKLSQGVAEVKAAGNIPLHALPSASVAGLLTSGEETEAAATVPQRTNGQKAWAMVAFNLLAFAVIFPNVTIGVSLLNLGSDSATLTVSLLVTTVVTLLLMNLMPGPARPDPIPASRILTTALPVFVVSWIIFAALVSALTQASDILYVPVEPTLTILPIVSALLVTPLVLDVIFDRQKRTLQQKVLTVLVPVVVFHALYPVFYGAAIGLVIAAEPMRSMVTALNVVLITLLVLHPAEVLWCIGKAAGWVVWLLRGLPQFLGQR